MSGIVDPLIRVLPAVLPTTLAATACACLLPLDTVVAILTALTAWVCAAVPVGVLVGHCTLSEP